MRVFFYGLFMDEGLLEGQGISPAEVSPAFVDGFGLRIGERATLVRHPDYRAYGVLMDITPDEANTLYAEESVVDYEPEPVIVTLIDGTQVEAICYNLPEDKIAGFNPAYAKALLDLATRLEIPAVYLNQIRQAQQPLHLRLQGLCLEEN